MTKMTQDEVLAEIEAAKQEERRPRFVDADLSDANLCDADLCDADLSDASLCDADLRWANLSDANLSDANLCDADLSDANLSDANLRWANLSDANLCGADLSWASLRWANLCGANLCGANLRWANLCDADLRGADLRGANLCGADLSEALWDGLVCPTPSGRLLLIPTSNGWTMSIGCWDGTPDDLQKMLDGPDDDWPEARGEERTRREPYLRAALHLCHVHMDDHTDVITDLAARFGQGDSGAA